jgi:exopolysaccharide biosynthesis WecB/TagA/CpsF family protein
MQTAVATARPTRSNTTAPADRQALAPRALSLFDIEVTDTTIAEAARWLTQRAAHGIATTAGFVNAHCINVAYRDPAYRDSLETCDRVLIDGAGMKIAAKAFGHDLQDNVNGTDLFPVLCSQAAAANMSLYLIGGREGIAAGAAERMVETTENLRIAGTAPAYFETPEEESRAIKQINASGAKLVLVGMGVPLQETWIARNRDRIEAPVVLGVGGLFDYYSGRIPRAPMLLRKSGLEWAWRLAMEPRRLARRYLLGNIEFLTRLAALKIGSKATGKRILQTAR